MLLNLHVKNIALIDEADVNLEDGLNILTGETGAGKSILIDAVNMALGVKTARGLLRDGDVPACCELLFQVFGKEKKQALKALGVELEEEDMVLISRKMTQKKSICKINDETVTMSKLRAVTQLLIDIHGQNDHQSLLHKAKHLEILDSYARFQLGDIRKKYEQAYDTYCIAENNLEAYAIGEEERLRELDFLEYEIAELSGAGIKCGEIEELEQICRKLANGQRIAEHLSKASALAGESGAADLVGRCVKELAEASEYDAQAGSLLELAQEAEGLLQDLNRALSDYSEEMEYDEADLREKENRMDVLHNLQMKYGETYEEMMESLAAKQDRFEKLSEFDSGKKQAREDYDRAREEVLRLAGELSSIRKVEAFHLSESIRSALVDLNFLEVQFSVEFTEKEEPGRSGRDEVEFMISTNPGEALKPLAQVASGGELSRIMLAVKAVLADSDEIETLIFDEIDAGISGRTAQKVSEKLNDIGQSHQVICITHLPQIAAMADSHFKIEKSVKNGRTVTEITKLNETEQIEELCRLLGGAAITDAVEENAREMKELAQTYKR